MPALLGYGEYVLVRRRLFCCVDEVMAAFSHTIRPRGTAKNPTQQVQKEEQQKH
jgi:hypothetical protein